MAECEKPKLFTLKCYKVVRETLRNPEEFKMTTAFFDTGAGSYPNREGVLPIAWLGKAQNLRASIRATEDTTFNTKGILYLKVEIGGQKRAAVFGVAPELTAEVILGTALISKEIESVETKYRQIKPRGCRTVAIVGCFRSYEGKKIVKPAKDA